jgi:hypothetical protein
MTRIPRLVIAFMLLAVMTAVAGCGELRAAPAESPSASGPSSDPVIRLSAGGRALVPGGPPLAVRVSVAGLTAAQAGRRQLALYIGSVPDRLLIREDDAWHEVRLQWTNEQEDDGEFVAIVPLSYRGRERTEIDFQLFTADQQISYVDNQVPAVRNTIAAELAQGGRPARTHPAASAARLNLPIDATHLTVDVPRLLRAAEGGPAVGWYVRVRNAAGKRTRSGLHIAIYLDAGSPGASARRMHWSIDRQGRWTDLTGRTHIETDAFTLKPGEARTVRIRIALPVGATAGESDDVGAMLAASVSAPWWPSAPNGSSGIGINPESTNVLAES